MFHSARVKLTLWYLLIIMAISIIFSLVIFRIQLSEAERILQRQRVVSERIGILRPGFSARSLDPDILEEARNRLMLNLIFINLGVLIFSGGAAYFLSGRTLKPIQEMVDDQKRFIADASHELRTPLTTMKTQLEVSLRDKKVEKEAKKVLESNLEEVNKLSYLSDKLLRLSNYGQGEAMSFSEVSLKEALEEATKKISGFAKTKRIEIRKDLERASIQGNLPALVEAFGTILDNSVKYSPKNAQVNLSSKMESDKAVVKIQDLGIGIKESDIPHIFDRFYRADTSRTKEKVDGFGLGLSIAKAVVDKHQGKIEVESTLGEGTTFTITLPKEINSQQFLSSSS